MIFTLNGYPKNKAEFIRLLAFFKQVLDICADARVTPMLDGSLAVFVYTQNREMIVNDIDLSCSEADFAKIMVASDKWGIDYKLREWHVLQLLQDDLKIELGSAEFWMQGLPMDFETLQIDDYDVKMLAVDGLKAFYRQAMIDRAAKADEPAKYEALKEKYQLLESVS